MKNLKLYVRALRLPFITASALLVIFTGLYVYTSQGIFNWNLFLLTLLGVSFAHLASNTINDYFDWDKSDKVNAFATEFNGGSRKNIEGNFFKFDFLKMSIVLFILSLILFMGIVFSKRPLAIYFGLAGLILGSLYSFPPFSLQSRGLGESVIFLAFGPLITAATGYILTGMFSLNHALIGIPAGLFVTAIIWINEFPDFIADREVGKKTLVVRMGLKTSRYAYLTIFFLAYAFVVYFVIIEILPLLSLITLLGVPIALSNIVKLWTKFEQPKELVPVQAKTIMLHALSMVLLIISVLPFFN